MSFMKLSYGNVKTKTAKLLFHIFNNNQPKKKTENKTKIKTENCVYNIIKRELLLKYSKTTTVHQNQIIYTYNLGQ